MNPVKPAQSLISRAAKMFAPHNSATHVNRFMSSDAWKSSRGQGVLGGAKRVGSEVAEALTPRRSSGSIETAMGVAMPALAASSDYGKFKQQLGPKMASVKESVLNASGLRMEKSAAMKSSDVASIIGKALAAGTGLAAGGALIGAAGHGVGSAYTRLKAGRMFDELSRRHPEIKKSPQAKEYFDLIVAFAPSLLRHPSAIGDFLRRQLQYPMSSVEFIKQLADLESTVARTESSSAGRSIGRSGAEFGAGAAMSQILPKP